MSRYDVYSTHSWWYFQHGRKDPVAERTWSNCRTIVMHQYGCTEWSAHDFCYRSGMFLIMTRSNFISRNENQDKLALAIPSARARKERANSPGRWLKLRDWCELVNMQKLWVVTISWLSAGDDCLSNFHLVIWIGPYRWTLAHSYIHTLFWTIIAIY
jgi:hypothetical protein